MNKSMDFQIPEADFSFGNGSGSFNDFLDFIQMEINPTLTNLSQWFLLPGDWQGHSNVLFCAAQ